MMGNFKGTKGKWVVKENPYYLEVKFIEDTSSGTISLHLYSGERFDDMSKSDENKANAILISKAPEMLEMLEKLASANPMHDGFHELRLKAINLIKEATEL